MAFSKLPSKSKQELGLHSQKEKNQNQNLIVNLSDYVLLTDIEQLVLNLGLGFVPTPKYNTLQTHIDLFVLVRQLKLHAYFGNSESNETVLFKPKSTFVPYVSEPSIAGFERLVLQDIENLENEQKKKWFNHTQEEFMALQNLSQNRQMTIKQADKGGAMVLMNTMTTEMVRQCH